MRQYKEIEFNGQAYPVSFNRYALGRFMRAQNITIEQFANLSQDLETIQQLVYHGLIGGHAAKHSTEIEMTYMDFCMDLADDNDAMAAAMEYFAEQNAETEKKQKAARKRPSVVKP